MRLRLALALVALHAAPPVAAVEGASAGEAVELEEGKRHPVQGFRPLCDDPSIARFVVDGKGAIAELEGLKAGRTTCSISRGSPVGPRTIYRITVVPRPTKGKGTGSGGAGGS